jgi:hypothetical protein
MVGRRKHDAPVAVKWQTAFLKFLIATVKLPIAVAKIDYRSYELSLLMSCGLVSCF